MTDVKFTSHKDEFLAEAEAAITRALERIGLRAERNAKSYCPVDTGRLRNSITYATQSNHDNGSSPAKPEDYTPNGTPGESRVVIGTNVEYAPYVELGSSKRSPHAFLRPAVQLHVDEFKRIVKSELKGS